MTRYTLKIVRQDSSIYWIAYFNSLDLLNHWLTEEQTRPYWDNTWTTHIYTQDDLGVEAPYVP